MHFRDLLVHCDAYQYAAPHSTALCCIVEYWIILHYTELCWTTLHCTALYYVFHIWCFTKLEYCNVKSVTSLNPKLFSVRWIVRCVLLTPFCRFLLVIGQQFYYNYRRTIKAWTFCKQICFDILWVFWSLQTSLLCIVREFAGEGSVVVVVAVSVSRMRDFFYCLLIQLQKQTTI